ncbi:hypothetical protein CRE_08695 [Caenorhabditis remanei]|uniref:Reverse transcriptase domain-containing protein n=1 Tax=Caenorhabditis remanei TaxID=31234 RepID=E3LJE4_CAERE|nr:hypothetical protein CRE_08695 [Caenorhabditis remanei]
METFSEKVSDRKRSSHESPGLASKRTKSCSEPLMAVDESIISCSIIDVNNIAYPVKSSRILINNPVELYSEDIYSIIMNLSNTVKQLETRVETLVSHNDLLSKKVGFLDLNTSNFQPTPVNVKSSVTYSQIVSKTKANSGKSIKHKSLPRDKPINVTLPPNEVFKQDRRASFIIKNAELLGNPENDLDGINKLSIACGVPEVSSVFRIIPKSGPPILKVLTKSPADATKILSKFSIQCSPSKSIQNGPCSVPPMLERSDKFEQRAKVLSIYSSQSEGGKNKLSTRPVTLGMGNSRAFLKCGEIRIGYANCNSISNKLNTLNFLCYFHNFDVFCMSETKLDGTFTDGLLSLDQQYSVIRKDRNKHGGGVAILISKHLKCVPITIPDKYMSAEVCAVNIFTNGTTTRVITAYHPNHQRNKSILLEVLEYLLGANKHTVLVGDFNMPCIDWRILNASDKPCTEFINFVVRNGLSQHVKTPTRFGPDNILDLCLCNTDIIQEVSVLEPFSDHCLIQIKLSCTKNSRKIVKETLHYKKGDYNTINCILSRINWPRLFSKLTINEMYSFFTSYLKELLSNFVPTIRIDDSKKFYPPSIKKLQKEKLKIWRKEGNSPRFKSISASIKVQILVDHKKKFEDKLVSGNQKNFFKLINSKLKDSNYVGPIKDGNATLCDEYDKVECFSSTFSDVFVLDDGTVPSFAPRTDNFIEEVSYEPYMVEAVLSKLQPKCNTSPDGIPSIVLKELCTSIALPLSLIFNRSLQAGTLPDIWKTAMVIPVFKKGARSNPGNYRPISLTCSTCKVLEKLVRRSILEHLSINKLLSNAQYGFRSRMNTELQLLNYVGLLISNLEQKKPVNAVYIDFRKVFDTVAIPKLKVKLKAYGIQGKLLNWINSFLSGRSQKVLLNGLLSNYTSVDSGVPQGSVLGPILFILYINDIGDKLESNPLLYADDLKLISPDAVTIQNDMKMLSEWCNTWQMNVAPKKCELITFFKSRKKNVKSNPLLNISLNGLRLPKCEIIRDLGVIFSSDLSFDSHINSVIVESILFEVILKCYKVFIRPIIEYGSTIYSPTLKCLIKKLESVQKSFIYRCSKKFNFEYISYFKTLETYELESLEYRRLLNDLVYLYKIIVSKEFYSPNLLFTLFPNLKSLRRHPFHIRSLLSNNSKFGAQYLPNRLLSCWNSLPVNVFPVKTSSRCFRNNVKLLDFSNYLTLNMSTY